MAIGDVRVAALDNISYPCISLNGSGDRVSIVNTPVNLSNSWSIGCWIFTGNTARNSICGDANASSGYIYINDGVKGVSFEPAKDGQGCTFTYTPYGSILNKWVHFMLTATPTGMTLYLDGVAYGGTQVPTNGDILFNVTRIGMAYTTLAGDFNGLMRDLKFWGKELSANEVLIESQQGSISDKLINRWIFNGNANDSVGSANGTLVGQAYFKTMTPSIKAEYKAARAGSSDKYLMTFDKRSGAVITATINES